MISVVCVYNNERTLRDVLLNSLKNQTVAYELIAIDNTDSSYNSAAKALNIGGSQAKGDLIMFTHHDMWLGSESWLEDAEKLIASIPDLGIAGVAGQSIDGRNWEERCRWSIDFFYNISATASPVNKPEEVQTLDECLLIVPKKVFNMLKFDEKTFDSWHCYGADYCLSVSQLGLKAYVIPGISSHSCKRKNLTGLLKYQKRLYNKHRKTHNHIYTWTGYISWRQLQLECLFNILRPIYRRIFPTATNSITQALADCDTLLDLGCGQHSILADTRILDSMKLSVGVELYEPYLLESKRKRIHTQYIKGDVRRIAFKPRSFDAVVAFELLEHLTKEEGLKLLNDMEEWAKKKVVITTPNGYVWQDDYDDNLFQVHKSGWKAEELKKLFFIVYGLCGWKKLRGYKSSIKYRPAFLWVIISDLTQKIVYRYPRLAFDLLAIKQVNVPDK